MDKGRGYEGSEPDSKRVFPESVFYTPEKKVKVQRISHVDADNPMLHKKTKDVSKGEILSSKMRETIQSMKEEIEKCGMVSGSANQFGLDLNLFIFKVPPQEEVGPRYQGLYAPGEGAMDWQIVFNATYEISPGAVLVAGPESSLANPGVSVDVERYSAIEARWIDGMGQEVRMHLEGLAAKIFQNKVEYCLGETQVDTYQPPMDTDADREEMHPAGAARVLFTEDEDTYG